jgi:Zn-dependent M28 family amino/carboxypeptidase
MTRIRAWRVALLAVVVGHGVWAQTPGGTSPAAAGIVDRPALLRDLQALSADAMEGRKVGTPGGARARAYLIERFAASGLAPFDGRYEQPFDLTPGRVDSTASRGANVLGQIRGTRRPDRYMVISAHYDHLGITNGTIFNGANDNASGAAALVAITRRFADRRPAHSLIIVAFDAEEAGLVGARAFVQSPPVARSAIALNLNLDMIGRETEGRLFVAGTRAQPSLRPIIARVAARAPLKLLMGHDDPADRRDDWTRDSDQYAFIEAGIPGLLFSVEDTAEHHKPTDDYETMTVGFYVRAVETVIDVVGEFDRNLDTVVREKQAARLAH